jgi:phage terminase large subunit-like protein
MTALVLVFAGDDGEFVALPFCWLPAETLQEACDRDRMPYTTLARKGHLLTCPGRSLDPKVVALKIAELHGIYKIQKLAFDRWRIEDIKREFRLSGACRLCRSGRLQRYGSRHCGALNQGKLLHGRHPLLTMAATSAKAELTQRESQAASDEGRS